MTESPLMECVPNFSEGRNTPAIRKITDAIASVPEVKLLNVDPGRDANRTVVTFVGPPPAVLEAAFLAIKTAAAVIDMSKQGGEHPRMGATDVCPFIPIARLTMEEAAAYAHQLGRRVGEELDIPVYMYENAATRAEWRNLANIRTGEYEALPEKLSQPEWKPDYGPARFNARAGATVIGARDFLIAYNVNLNTSSVRRAKAVAFDVRESGRVKRDAATGAILRDASGKALRVPGRCKGVKAFGWYIEEYGNAQISMNVTDIQSSPLHRVFETCRESADQRGLRVTGSELIGMVPRRVLLDAGKYYLRLQKRSLGVPEHEIIHIAVKSLGLDELAPFDPKQKVIEYRMESEADRPLAHLELAAYADAASREGAAPAGGSVLAYTGSLAGALTAMIANVSAHQPHRQKEWESFSAIAEKAQQIKDQLLKAVDDDPRAYRRLGQAHGLPKSSREEAQMRQAEIQDALRHSAELLLGVMHATYEIFDLLEELILKEEQRLAPDAAAAAACARAVITGACHIMQMNNVELADENDRQQKRATAERLAQEAGAREKSLLERVAAIVDAYTKTSGDQHP